MTTHSAANFDHDTIYDNDGISGFVPNLVIIKMFLREGGGRLKR